MYVGREIRRFFFFEVMGKKWLCDEKKGRFEWFEWNIKHITGNNINKRVFINYTNRNYSYIFAAKTRVQRF